MNSARSTSPWSSYQSARTRRGTSSSGLSAIARSRPAWSLMGHPLTDDQRRAGALERQQRRAARPHAGQDRLVGDVVAEVAAVDDHVEVLSQQRGRLVGGPEDAVPDERDGVAEDAAADERQHGVALPQR